MLAENIEHYKLQKVDHFYLYIKDSDAYLYKDCLQRSRYHSEYAIFSDLDERITPMISGITLREYVGDHIYQLKVLQGTTTLLKHLPTLIFTNSTIISPPGTLDKCILNPTMVFIMDVHNVAVFLQGDGRIYRVPPEHALIRFEVNDTPENHVDFEA
ncbi:unnamed protein product [Cylicocyclus nassatus]|uniref:Glycosyltransferase family 92 protein n=1 Tax=Cylicocyclus nassatus TaxID=53992 RepID=A0AA36H5Q1_CYLNA|nr:unnamed protein product [Cylicocyclus nassatus]